jgi:hypothetical protein
MGMGGLTKKKSSGKFGGTDVPPVHSFKVTRRICPIGKCRWFFQLVPKLYLGTKMGAKLSLAGKSVPKHRLGTRAKVWKINYATFLE